MRIVRQSKNQVAVIFTLREIQTIEYLTRSGQMVQFADAREYIEQGLKQAREYLDHYEGVAIRGESIT